MEEIQTGSFKRESFDFSKWRKPILLTGGVIVLAAIIATFVLLVFKNSNSQTAICTQKANLALMNQAAADINSHNIT